MTIYPAIDIRGGRVVRLRRGDMGAATDYGDPREAARRWHQEGAQYLHIVDLDGAVEGIGVNLQAIRQVVCAVPIPVQMGGGIRTLEDIRIRLEDVGVQRVILGTAAIGAPEMVEEACARWPGRVVCGMDVREGKVAIRGWLEDSALTPAQVLPGLRQIGVETVIYTDISRDGMMQGPNIEATRDVVATSGMKVIGSGGVSSLEDIRRLKQIGCEGVILGKSLYAGAVALGDALALAKE